jgi:hypothetical protein
LDIALAVCLHSSFRKFSSISLIGAATTSKARRRINLISVSVKSATCKTRASIAPKFASTIASVQILTATARASALPFILLQARLHKFAANGSLEFAARIRFKLPISRKSGMKAARLTTAEFSIISFAV